MNVKFDGRKSGKNEYEKIKQINIKHIPSIEKPKKPKRKKKTNKNSKRKCHKFFVYFFCGLYVYKSKKRKTKLPCASRKTE